MMKTKFDCAPLLVVFCVMAAVVFARSNDSIWIVGFVKNQSVDTREEPAVRVPLENYLKAHVTGNGDFIRQAFHRDAKIMSFRDNKFNQLTVEEFAARFTGKPAIDEASRKRSIENINITGNAAAAKIVLDYPTIKFTDYMSLLKIDGEWKIVNKSFYAEPKNQK